MPAYHEARFGDALSPSCVLNINRNWCRICHVPQPALMWGCRFANVETFIYIWSPNINISVPDTFTSAKTQKMILKKLTLHRTRDLHRTLACY
jgi:hypothetical protein